MIFNIYFPMLSINISFEGTEIKLFLMCLGDIVPSDRIGIPADPQGTFIFKGDYT